MWRCLNCVMRTLRWMKRAPSRPPAAPARRCQAGGGSGGAGTGPAAGLRRWRCCAPKHRTPRPGAGCPARPHQCSRRWGRPTRDRICGSRRPQSCRYTGLKEGVRRGWGGVGGGLVVSGGHQRGGEARACRQGGAQPERDTTAPHSTVPAAAAAGTAASAPKSLNRPNLVASRWPGWSLASARMCRVSTPTHLRPASGCVVWMPGGGAGAQAQAHLLQPQRTRHAHASAQKSEIKPAWRHTHVLAWRLQAGPAPAPAAQRTWPGSRARRWRWSRRRRPPRCRTAGRLGGAAAVGVAVAVCGEDSRGWARVPGSKYLNQSGHSALPP